jgi:hypothetical protein
MSAKPGPNAPKITWQSIGPWTHAARFGDGWLVRHTIIGDREASTMVYVPDAQAFPDVVFGADEEPMPS